MINILFYKMEVQNNLKSLFNQIFPDSIGTEKTPSNLEYCFSKLLESNQKDYLITSIHLFFYPSDSSKAKNKDKKFWFEDYEKSSEYSEYNFAIDLLLILKAYLTDKNTKAAYEAIEQIQKKLGSYKNVDYYMFLTEKSKVDTLVHLYSFFHQDINYFKFLFKVDVSLLDDLTNKVTLEKLFCGITISNRELTLYKNVMEMKQTLQNLVEFKKDAETKFKEMEEMKAKLEQIYLRDTLKYSIKYIYRLFFHKFGQGNQFQSKLYEEIKYLKTILNKPEFLEYNYLYEFIEAVEFGDLAALNIITHPSLEKRDFDIMKNYVDNKKPYLNKVITFLKNLPNLSDYINLEITYYIDKPRLEEEIKKKFDFESIYHQVIEK